MAPGRALDFYATPGRFTSLDPGDAVGADIGDVVRTVQGLLIYDLVAEPVYGIDLRDEQADAIHERYTDRLIDLARGIDARPLTERRKPANRIGARCHAYSRLTVAFLRAAGVPARARCGFSAYATAGWLEDHWVAEYWNASDNTWVMVDSQLDKLWRELFGFSGDHLALTPDEFVTAGHAWQTWRRGDLDAGRCGLTSIDEHGAHWIAGNLRLDFASLNKVEMLPWDVWGERWKPGEDPTDAQLELFDGIAALTVDPDGRFDDMQHRYRRDDRLRMDGSVYNVFRDRTETV